MNKTPISVDAVVYDKGALLFVVDAGDATSEDGKSKYELFLSGTDLSPIIRDATTGVAYQLTWGSIVDAVYAHQQKSA